MTCEPRVPWDYQCAAFTRPSFVALKTLFYTTSLPLLITAGGLGLRSAPILCSEVLLPHLQTQIRRKIVIMGGARRYGWSGFTNTAEYLKSLPSTPSLFAKRACYVRTGEAQAADKAASGVEMSKVRASPRVSCTVHGSACIRGSQQKNTTSLAVLGLKALLKQCTTPWLRMRAAHAVFCLACAGPQLVPCHDAGRGHDRGRRSVCEWPQLWETVPQCRGTWVFAADIAASKQLSTLQASSWLECC
jgi:hypothetical protein